MWHRRISLPAAKDQEKHHVSASCRWHAADGVALLIVMAALILVLGLSSALVLTSVVETRIAAASEDDGLALSAADAAIARVLVDLRGADWSAVLSGTVQSFSDGTAGARLLPDGSQIELSAETADMQCGHDSCTDAEIETTTEERPWGRQNPRWRLLAHGPIAMLFPGDPVPPVAYVVVWASDDPSDTDNNPFVDGAGLDNPGRGVHMVAARAYAASGTRRTVELVVERTGTDLRILSRHERHP